MARSSDNVDRLRQVERFSALSDAELKKVAAAGTSLHLPAHRTLMSENTPADKAYVIVSGEVAIRHGDQQVATVGGGHVVGEVGILEKRLRTAAVVSTTELDVIHFTHEDLARLVDEIPAFAAALQATADAHGEE